MRPTETGHGATSGRPSEATAGRFSDRPESRAEEARAAQPGQAPCPHLRRPAQVIQDYFDGDEALYFAFRANSLKQFANDIERGNTAVQAADHEALRRLAHNLRSVLLTLDESAAAQCATQLESRLLAGDSAGGMALWGALRSELQALGSPP